MVCLHHVHHRQVVAEVTAHHRTAGVLVVEAIVHHRAVHLVHHLRVLTQQEGLLPQGHTHQVDRQVAVVALHQEEVPDVQVVADAEDNSII